MHHKISQKLNIINELNNNLANSQKKDEEFSVEEYVTVKEFSAREASPSKIMNSSGPNAYVPEISPDLGISSTFIISDFVKSREPVVIPSEPLEPLPFYEREPTPERPHIIWPYGEVEIERALDDQAIGTQDRDCQRYFVRCQGQPESEDLWNAGADLQHLNPDPP